MGEAMQELIVNQLIVAIITLIVGTGGGAIAGYFVGRFKEHKKLKNETKEIEKARITIEKATARRLIFEAYDDYVIQRKHLTVDRFREISETYEAYILLKGNGTAKKYFNEISKINPYLVTD